MLLSRLLTWILLAGFGLVGLVLVRAALRSPANATNSVPLAAPLSGANFGLRAATAFFLLVCLVALGLHSYWALLSNGPVSSDPQYARLKGARDQRGRRLSESALRGWVFDRSHLPENALCRYQVVGGRVHREYPLGEYSAHILGYTGFLHGEAGVERAFAAQLKKPAKLWNTFLSSAPVGSDIALSLDFAMQRSAGEQLKTKRGAVVVLRVDTGEILALASSPGFDPKAAEGNEAWDKYVQDTDGQPFLNRALNDYYLPGSTFKTVVATAAIESGLTGQTFTCSAAGYTPPGSGRAIKDDKDEVHGTLNLAKAMEVSCNQYFAQMGVLVGRERLGDVARHYGLFIDESPESARQSRTVKQLWNTESAELDATFNVAQSRMMLSPRVTSYDVALQSIGQGFDQVTVLQMAMIAAAVGRTDGMLVAPALEAERPVKKLGAALTPAAATQLRPMLRAVVEKGTAARAFRGCRIPVAGKTGTAQVSVNGGRDLRIDAWFIGFAPADNPKIAFAVVVEAGGYGGERAAPIARTLVEQAERSGLLALPPPSQ
ncbi:MAG: hypothetical protein K1Y36_22535 [Blastocatellia bacterium]|nr:hypothetical protein [Blastocatellia bacterium]